MLNIIFGSSYFLLFFLVICSLSLDVFNKGIMWTLSRLVAFGLSGFTCWIVGYAILSIIG